MSTVSQNLFETLNAHCTFIFRVISIARYQYASEVLEVRTVITGLQNPGMQKGCQLYQQQYPKSDTATLCAVQCRQCYCNNHYFLWQLFSSFKKFL